MQNVQSSVIVRVRRDGTIVLPIDILRSLGIQENDLLEIVVEGNQLVLRPIRTDLWLELRERAKKMKLRVDLDRAEEELDEVEDLWLARHGR